MGQPRTLVRDTDLEHRAQEDRVLHQSCELPGESSTILKDPHAAAWSFVESFLAGLRLSRKCSELRMFPTTAWIDVGSQFPPVKGCQEVHHYQPAL